MLSFNDIAHCLPKDYQQCSCWFAIPNDITYCFPTSNQQLKRLGKNKIIYTVKLFCGRKTTHWVIYWTKNGTDWLKCIKMMFRYFFLIWICAGWKAQLRPINNILNRWLMYTKSRISGVNNRWTLSFHNPVTLFAIP